MEAEAKERQKLSNASKQMIADSKKGQARDKVANLTGANRQYVSDAKRIVEKDASMLERIRDGEVTIQEAKRQLGFKQSVIAPVSSELTPVLRAPGLTPPNYLFPNFMRQGMFRASEE